MNLSKYKINKMENKDKIYFDAFYQPDKNLSGFRYSFTYYKADDLMICNIGNGDVPEETKKYLLNIKH